MHPFIKNITFVPTDWIRPTWSCPSCLRLYYEGEWQVEREQCRDCGYGAEKEAAEIERMRRA